MPVNVKKMSPDDVPAVLVIEGACFPSPLKREDLLRFIESGLSFAVRENDEVKGYVVCNTVLDECHVERIAVDPVFRRKGIGFRLLSDLLEQAKASGIKKVYLEVRISNNAPRELYKKAGFKEIYVRKGYYADNNEDAVVMEKVL